MSHWAAHPLLGATRIVEPGVLGQIRLAWRLLRDPRVSRLKLALPVMIALYFLSPVDAIPDFLLGIGHIDDLGIVMAGLLLFSRLMPHVAPAEVVEEHLRDMGQAVKSTAPGSPNVVDARFSVRR